MGSVKLGHEHAGHITIHWNRQVQGQPLKNAHYLLLLQVHKGYRLTDVSEPIPIKIHRAAKHRRPHAKVAIFTPFALRGLSLFVFCAQREVSEKRAVSTRFPPTLRR